MTFIGQYILDDDGNPQPEPDSTKWAQWYETAHRSPGKDNLIVAKDNIGSAHVSTVFLGLDHNYWHNGPPILWETMIFGGEHNEYQRRYSSKEAAIIGHNEAVEMVKASQADLQELNRMALAGGWEKK